MNKNYEQEFAVELSKVLIKLREEHNLSQKALSKMTGVNQPVISRIEKCLVSPRVGTVMKLLVPFGKTIAIVPAE